MEHIEKSQREFDLIIEQLLEKIDKPSIKNALKDNIIINRMSSDSIHFITISKVAQLMFANQENMKYIENKLSEIIGKPVTIQVTFENKEAYFMRKLGL